jgi:hypothetical protein
LYLTNKGQLNIIQSQDDPKTKKSKLRRIMRKFRSIHKANLDFSKQLKIFGRIFDSLNITFNRKEIKFDGKIRAGGYQSADGQEGITEDYIVTDVIIEEVGGVEQTRYVRKRIMVKDGLIVGQQIISQ